MISRKITKTATKLKRKEYVRRKTDMVLDMVRYPIKKFPERLLKGVLKSGNENTLYKKISKKSTI